LTQATHITRVCFDKRLLTAAAAAKQQEANDPEGVLIVCVFSSIIILYTVFTVGFLSRQVSLSTQS
jgi:hypothetical protein